MNSNGIGHRLATAALAFLAALALPASAPSMYSSSVSVDWPGGCIRLEASLDLAAAGIRLPSGRLEAERLLDTAAPGMALTAVLELGLDSYRKLNDALGDGTLTIADLNAYLEAWSRGAPVLSYDGRTISARYEWSLPLLAGLFVRHSVPVGQRQAESYTPTRAYSGIVIFAQGSFPVRGEHLENRFSPTLYPRVYDENMEAVLERNVMDPEALRAQGPVAYAYSLNDPVVERRAGADPLRIMPVQVFGSRRTDAVISARDAQRILASPENRELVRLGKVVFVLDPPAPGKP